MVREALAKARWREIDLATQPKGHRLKVRIAQLLRRQTPMNRQWIADRLGMGSASYVSNLLGSVDGKL
jgi:predicted transcriptional regulator